MRILAKEDYEAGKVFKKHSDKTGKVKELTSFNPYRMKDKNSEIFNKGLPYVFITAPRINFSDDNISRDSFFTYLKNIKPEVMKSLNFSNIGTTSSGNPFVPIFSNRFMGMSIPDTQTVTKEFHETFYGFKQTLPIGNVGSVAGGEITVEFEENKRTDIIHTLKGWANYVEGVTRGYLTPSDDAKNRRYIDYTSSIYYFLLDFDGETILHFTKFTGCYPINIPYDIFSTNIGDVDVPHVSANFAYSFKEDMDPDILLDFNRVSVNASTVASASSKAQRTLMESNSKGTITPVGMNSKLTYEEMYPINVKQPYIVMGSYGEDNSIPRFRLRYL